MSGLLPTNFMHWQDKSVPSDELAFVPATNTFINRQRDRTGYRAGFLACALQPLPEGAGSHVELAGNADNATRAAMPGFEQCLLFEFGRVM